MESYPINLHQQQGVNHLNRVLEYAPFVAEDGRAAVHLTAEDWHVVADTLFRLETPVDLLPDAVQSFQLTNGNSTIELKTEELIIDLEMI